MQRNICEYYISKVYWLLDDLKQMRLSPENLLQIADKMSIIALRPSLCQAIEQL